MTARHYSGHYHTRQNVGTKSSTQHNNQQTKTVDSLNDSVFLSGSWFSIRATNYKFTNQNYGFEIVSSYGGE